MNKYEQAVVEAAVARFGGLHPLSQVDPRDIQLITAVNDYYIASQQVEKKEIEEIEPLNPSGKIILYPKEMGELAETLYGFISETIQKLNEVIAAVNKLNEK